MKAAEFNDKPPCSLMKLNDTIAFFHMQMPRWLFCDSRYKTLSLEAKVAYTFLLNRFQLSRMNGWVNADSEVFVVFTREALANEMGVSTRKAIQCFQELSDAGLIWERRLGRGYPNQIYLVSVELSVADAAADTSAPFSRHAESACLGGGQASAPESPSASDMQEPQVLNCENGTSKAAESAGQDLQYPHPNKIEKNEIDFSKIDRSPSDARTHTEQLDALLAGCGLDSLSPNEAGVLRNAIERLWYAERFTVDGIELPREKLRADLCRLNPSILAGTLEKLKGNSPGRIRNTTAYVMAALMNNIWECVSDELLDPERLQIEKEVRLITRQMRQEGDG